MAEKEMEVEMEMEMEMMEMMEMEVEMEMERLDEGRVVFFFAVLHHASALHSVSDSISRAILVEIAFVNFV